MQARVTKNQLAIPIHLEIEDSFSFPHVLGYTSGTNRCCDIRGAAKARVAIGVDVSRLSESAILALIESRVPLLLDSGAFGREFADSLTWLSSAQRRWFAEDPDGFLRKQDCDDWLYASLTQQYLAYLRKHTRRAARTKAVAEGLQQQRLK